MKLHPDQTFALLKTKSVHLLKVISQNQQQMVYIPDDERLSKNKDKVLNLAAVSKYEQLMDQELGAEIYQNYRPLFKKYLLPFAEEGKMYLHDPVKVAELKSTLFKPRMEGSEEDYLCATYDITQITAGRWPSRTRTIEQNIKANTIPNKVSGVNHIRMHLKRSCPEPFLQEITQGTIDSYSKRKK